MTISEANAVNVLLTYFLGRLDFSLHEPTDQELRQAAERLASNAYRALSAGWNPERVGVALEARAFARAGMLTGAKRARP